MLVQCRGIGAFPSMEVSMPLPTVRMLVQEERGVSFQVGPAFYRRQSSLARDLGMLLAAVHRQQTGRLRVLDVMSGCGVRAVRYLLQARADFVWANDACNDLMDLLALNLSQGVKAEESQELYNLMKKHTDLTQAGQAEPERWRITRDDANKVLLGCAVRNEYYDLIDVDSFGSDTLCLGPAMGAVKYGGLVYLTCTDGFSAGGHRPHNALASYGAFINPMPYANEIGLRMLIGGAVREAATRNMKVSPVFSNYSYHGPVFRTMLRVEPGKGLRNKDYGYIVYCKLCGQSQDVQHEDLGEIACCCCSHSQERGSLVVSGPLWIGPLHDTKQVESMIELAREWGWIKATGARSRSDSPVDMRILEELLEVMVDESQPGLPSGYIEMHEIGRRSKLQTPRRKDFIKLLQWEGYVASRSHVDPNAVKTNCPMDQCIELARTMR